MDRLRARLALACRLDQDPAFGRTIWVAHVNLQQEAVELRLGKRIGAFLFQRVLRRKDMEWPRQIIARAGDGHMMPPALPGAALTAFAG